MSARQIFPDLGPGAVIVERADGAGTPLDAMDPEEWADVLETRAVEARNRGNDDLASDLDCAADVIRTLWDRVP